MKDTLSSTEKDNVITLELDYQSTISLWNFLTEAEEYSKTYTDNGFPSWYIQDFKAGIAEEIRKSILSNTKLKQVLDIAYLELKKK